MRGASRVDALRVLAGAAVASTATIVLLCLLAWAFPVEHPGPALIGPVLAMVPVLSAVAVLVAIGIRLTIRGGSIGRPGAPSPTDEANRPRRDLVVSEVAVTAVAGAFAGVQAHLALRSLPASTPPAVRHLLAVGASAPWPAVAAVLAAVPSAAALAAFYATSRPPPRLQPRIPPYLGPLVMLAGLLGQYLIADPGHTERLSHGAVPASVAGYGTVLTGAALTVPWLLTWLGSGWASRAGRVWTLCAARRIEASAGGLALPLGLATIALAVVTTSTIAGDRTSPGMADAPLFLTMTTMSSCAAAMLFTVVVEHAPARRETSRTLRSIGAGERMDRRATLAVLVVPVLLCVAISVGVGALTAWPARGNGDSFPTVPTHAALLGTIWTLGLLAIAVIAAAVVTLRDERPHRV
ncbi:FtsX-like permease family protein [Embleya scabrispora]|uniref:FtsX-like permease family protein n=1 Tax=Embleya scabrispora TaxID=159449 RepID=UPI00039A1C9D|nr:hypothetical protein [Embleya scabrispora]MYS87230.1 hypothetical protein [Streptomyces sp. SID5474]